MMTLEEAVTTYEQYAQDAKNEKLNETFKYYEQLAAWLRELVERRKEPEIVRCKDCVHFRDNGSTVGYCKRKARHQYTDYFCGDSERRTDGQM